MRTRHTIYDADDDEDSPKRKKSSKKPTLYKKSRSRPPPSIEDIKPLWDSSIQLDKLEKKISSSCRKRKERDIEEHKPWVAIKDAKIDTETIHSTSDISKETSSSSMSSFIEHDKIKKEKSELSKKIAKFLSDELVGMDTTEVESLVHRAMEKLDEGVDEESVSEDLSSEEKEKFSELTAAIEAEEPKLKEILGLETSDTKLKNLIERYNIFKYMEPYTEERLAIKKYIREEIKSINQTAEIPELRETEMRLEDITCNDDIILRKKILLANIPEEQRIPLYNRYKYMKSLPSNDSDVGKIKEWIGFVTELPYRKTKPFAVDISRNTPAEISEYILQSKTIMDKEMYGLERAKQEILYFINNKITNPKASEQQLALCGSKGTGKTSLVRMIGEVLGVPFSQISLGGMKDSSSLCGHDYTYVGAQAGEVARAMKKMGYCNSIIFFDEVDKVDEAHSREVSNCLLSITDYSQNSTYVDHYCSPISLYLSQCFFIYAFNDETVIDPILRDRLYIVHLQDYKEEEKIEIAKRHLIPKAISNVGMKPEDITINDEQLRTILKLSPKEGGVRKLNDLIRALITRINFLRINHDNLTKLGMKNIDISLPIVITDDVISLLLNEVTFKKDDIPMGMYM